MSEVIPSKTDLATIRERHEKAEKVREVCKPEVMGDMAASGWFCKAHDDRAALLAYIDGLGAPETKTAHEWLANAMGGFTCDYCGAVSTLNPAAPCVGRDAVKTTPSREP